jgi:hypothetical protein
MELANFQAKKLANISREKRVPEWCNFQILVIFGHLQGGSLGGGVPVQTGLQSLGYLVQNI